MAKLAVYFEDALSSEDPRKLTQYCWFLITIHFCLRGQELQSTLKNTDIVINEEEGVTSIRLRTDFLTKNSAGGINSECSSKAVLAKEDGDRGATVHK